MKKLLALIPLFLATPAVAARMSADNAGSAAGGGGGAGGSIRTEDGGVFVVNTTTLDFTGAQFNVTDNSGEGLVTLNSSSVTLLGQNPPAASIAAGALGASVIASSVANNSVNLGTHTTGAYISSINATSPITVTANGVETANVTVAVTQNAGTDITADLEEETHASEHQDGGSDEISVTGLSGLLADQQKIKISTGGTEVAISSAVNFQEGTATTLTTSVSGDGTVNIRYNANQNAGTDITADLEEETHVTEHQNSGADELNVDGLDGTLNTAQKHAVSTGTTVMAVSTFTAFVAGSNMTITAEQNSSSTTIRFASSGGGGSGASFLAVGTGTTSGVTGTITSSGTTVIIADQDKFTTQLLGGTTVFLGLKPQAATNIQARVFNSTNPIISSGTTIAPILFDSEDSDTDSIHSIVSNTGRLTANTSGHYSIFGTVVVSTPTGADAGLMASIVLNGSTQIAKASWVQLPTITAASTNAVERTVNPYTQIDLLVGDYVELYVLNKSTVSVTISTRATFGMSLMTGGGGGSGTPAGVDTQLQYNNGGAFGGASAMYDDSVGTFTFTGAVLIDTPTVSVGAGANRGSLGFSPESGTPIIGLKTYSLTSTSVGLAITDASDNSVGSFTLNPQSNGAFNLKMSSYSGGSDTVRWSTTRNTSIHQFKDRLGATVLQIEPEVGNSSFTIPVHLSTITATNRVVFSHLNCSGNSNGGALTADSNGLVTCSDDDSGSGSFDPTATFTSSSIFKTDTFSAASGVCQSTQGCTSIQQYETATTTTVYMAVTFSDSATSYWQLTSAYLPESYVNGSTITVQIVWASTGTSGVVSWYVDAKAVRDLGAIDGSWGTAVEITDTNDASQDLLVSAESSAITIANSPVGGDRYWIRVYRATGDTSDTWTGDARMLGIRVTFTYDKLSSRD